MSTRVKKDCFAYDEKRCTCRALNALYCVWGECKFYKQNAEDINNEQPKKRRVERQISGRRW